VLRIGYGLLDITEDIVKIDVDDAVDRLRCMAEEIVIDKYYPKG